MERRPAAHGVLDHRSRTENAARVARDPTGRRAGRVGGPAAAALRQLRLQGRPAPDNPVDRRRRAGDDRSLRPTRNRVRTRRGALPRPGPRERSCRIALDRAGACRRALGTIDA